ncbi:MAG: hypothetical protein LBQ96_08900 [Fusobacteriaceae bacterium]|jgi:hypothetical protein|nr:hypothetical protein [Fusobacteriaceae bacterium]
MKKSMALGALILTLAGTAYGRPWNRGFRYRTSAPGVYIRCYESSDGYRDYRVGFTGEQNRRNEKLSKDLENLRITLAEKELEIRKEFNKDAPDWNKIEKIRVEMATERIKFRTKIQREFYEELKKKEAEQKVNENKEVKA